MSTFLQSLILAAVAGGYYLISCWRYPRVPCRWCGGKAPRDPLIRRAFGSCAHCGGKGYKARWGTRLTGKEK